MVLLSEVRHHLSKQPEGTEGYRIVMVPFGLLRDIEDELTRLGDAVVQLADDVQSIAAENADMHGELTYQRDFL